MRLDDCRMNEFVADLRQSYHLALEDAGVYGKYTKKLTLLERATHKPAKSFYVSLEEGTRLIHQIEKNGISGVKNSVLTSLKYNDLYRVYQVLREKNPNVPDLALIQLAVDSPAPRFYIRPQTAGLILNKYIHK